ncbi:hypothetical protein [Alsobacter soli]|nr:hypothetical protein [Alsobacter soli]
MVHGYCFTQLSRLQVDQCFPLLIGLLPALTLERWRDVCARAEMEGARLFGLVRGEYVRGLCSTQVWPVAADRLSLGVPLFVVPSALDHAAVTGAMIRGLRRLCASEGLERLQIVAPSDPSTRQLLERSGPDAIRSTVVVEFTASFAEAGVQ